ncbi:DUF421 domain-containing protein [Adhaeretor mobilis]|uniref:YetF C-terminal domain-containing protein n=1 Tax=Adhaeretor mobilis TaxID=1930276 RepID=A0A517MX51_9BACT|nr:YetF domain-containing protein [Adhaeretor mobilis]QDS99458.1 hypothetical protein HG15A2_27810 [Adhaeretor mobilis]
MNTLLLALTAPEGLRIVLAVAATCGAILAFTRVCGLRSFSKMSAADFAMTVAVGSLFASTIATGKQSLMAGILCIALLFSGQWIVAWARRCSPTVSRLVDNKPLHLMRGSTILDKHLARANVSRDDLFGKLREANALNYDQVLAVVFEITGDISVLHSTDAEVSLEPDFLRDVKGDDT